MTSCLQRVPRHEHSPAPLVLAPMRPPRLSQRAAELAGLPIVSLLVDELPLQPLLEKSERAEPIASAGSRLVSLDLAGIADA